MWEGLIMCLKTWETEKNNEVAFKRWWKQIAFVKWIPFKCILDIDEWLFLCFHWSQNWMVKSFCTLSPKEKKMHTNRSPKIISKISKIYNLRTRTIRGCVSTLKFLQNHVWLGQSVCLVHSWGKGAS